MSYLRRLADLTGTDVDLAGGKGANLGELIRAGMPVPEGFVITTDGYRAFRQAGALPDELAAELSEAYAALGSDAAVAVRSSATTEDAPETSFAGQLDTLLNVVGDDALRAAVQHCWASLDTDRAISYRAQHGIEADDAAVAVVVQPMVPADAAGVMFTANPATGRRDELVISAAWGLGEAVVSGQVDTDDLVLDKITRQVTSRRTAEKSIMTSYGPTGTIEEAVPAARRSERVLDDAEAAALAAYGLAIEDHFGTPQDIEWARTGDDFFILQARPITALPEPADPAPTDWSVPDNSAMYARASIVEQLPDPLTPLFAELIDGSVTRSLQALFVELIGEGVVRSGDVGLTTVNGYAYYRYSRSGMIRLTWYSTPAFRALLSTGDRGVVHRWRTYSHPRYQAAVADWTGRVPEELTDGELLAGVSALLDAGTEYYTSVQTLIPVAATTEIVFTAAYERLIRRAGDPAASTLLLGFDSEPIRAEQSLYELARWAEDQPSVAEALRAADDDRLLGDDQPLAEFRRRFDEHLARFGHAVYNLDFANAVPADAPGPLLDAIRYFLDGGTDPVARQQQSAARRDATARAIRARLDPVRRSIFDHLLRWAQTAAPIREDALADVGLGWPVLRRLARELGGRLVERGVIERRDDVFWLQQAEILDPGPGLVDRIEQRKRQWRGQRRATPPQLLPKGSWVEVWRRYLPAASEDQTGDVITGTPGSSGVVTAPARVLDGPEDFASMQPGEVLVASITTPAWTSLFARAAAVVTDIGGPLSHSSIVAREYGIPAVLGTAVGTRRITTGQRIRVDGDAGTVTLLDADAPDDEGPLRQAQGAKGSAEGAKGSAQGAKGAKRAVLILVAAAVAAIVIIRRRRAQR